MTRAHNICQWHLSSVHPLHLSVHFLVTSASYITCFYFLSSLLLGPYICQCQSPVLEMEVSSCYFPLLELTCLTILQIYTFIDEKVHRCFISLINQCFSLFIFPTQLQSQHRQQTTNWPHLEVSKKQQIFIWKLVNKGGEKIKHLSCLSYELFFRISWCGKVVLFIFKSYLFMRDTERGRDTGRGRGRSRLPTGSPMWDSSKDSRITPRAKGRCSTTEPSRHPRKLFYKDPNWGSFC